MLKGTIALRIRKARLLDRFAIKALPDVIKSHIQECKDSGLPVDFVSEDDCTEIAECAYNIALAMIRQRNAIVDNCQGPVPRPFQSGTKPDPSPCR